jgi:hypothetical protein
MAWTIEEIEKDWLASDRIAVSAENVVAAFERCERVLGRDWIYARHAVEVVGGLTLGVVTTGQRLASLDGVANTGDLVEKLRRGDRSAAAELHALHLLRFRQSAAAEMYPPVARDGKTDRIPEFRVGSPNAWVYVEVTRPDQSKAYQRAQSALRAVTDLVEGIKLPFTLEIFLRRVPAADEVETIRANVARFCAARVAAGELPLEGLSGSEFLSLRQGESGHPLEFVREELPEDLGLMILTQGKPGEIVGYPHPGEEFRPRSSSARRVRGGPAEPDRHLLVRMPFLDERAAKFLRREAGQLPTDAPGLIMINVGAAPGAFEEWEPLIQQCFRPRSNTRVSGVCLFAPSVVMTPDGLACLSQTKLLVNPYAKVPLPPWVTETIADAGAEYEKVFGPRKSDAPRAYRLEQVALRRW